MVRAPTDGGARPQSRRCLSAANTGKRQAHSTLIRPLPTGLLPYLESDRRHCPLLVCPASSENTPAFCRCARLSFRWRTLSQRIPRLTHNNSNTNHQLILYINVRMLVILTRLEQFHAGFLFDEYLGPLFTRTTQTTLEIFGSPGPLCCAVMSLCGRAFSARWLAGCLSTFADPLCGCVCVYQYVCMCRGGCVNPKVMKCSGGGDANKSQSTRCTLRRDGADIEENGADFTTKTNDFTALTSVASRRVHAAAKST